MTNEAKPAIRLNDVLFRWIPNSPPVLDISELMVTSGERLFVRGPSGSGKTTLLNMLGGVGVPENGSVEVRGTDLTKLRGPDRDAFRADHVGFIFQMFNLVPYLSLVENVTLPCQFSAPRRAKALANSSSLEDEAARLLGAMGLDPAVFSGRATAELSAGQQQRVAVARSLMGAPELIIADEPTSALDTDARQTFMDLVLEEVAHTGATLVFVSHDQSLAERFDRTIELSDINRAGA